MTASHATRAEPYTRRQNKKIRAISPTPKTAEGNRAAVSVSPRAANDSATALKKKAGLSRKSTPLKVGTSHAPESFISRAISALRPSSGWINGNRPRPRQRDTNTTTTAMRPRPGILPDGELVDVLG